MLFSCQYYLGFFLAWITLVTSVHVKYGKCYIFKIVSMLLLSIKAVTCLTHDGIFMSILFRIVSSLNHFQLPLFMLSKVSVTCIR